MTNDHTTCSTSNSNILTNWKILKQASPYYTIATNIWLEEMLSVRGRKKGCLQGFSITWMLWQYLKIQAIENPCKQPCICSRWSAYVLAPCCCIFPSLRKIKFSVLFIHSSIQFIWHKTNKYKTSFHTLYILKTTD